MTDRWEECGVVVFLKLWVAPDGSMVSKEASLI